MQIGGKRVLTALGLLLLGFAAYQIGVYCWGSYHYRAAQKALEDRDFSGATAHLQKCLDAWPRDLAVRQLAAQTARRQDDYALARQHLRAWAEKGPRDAVVLEYTLLSVQQGELSEANRLLAFCDSHPEAPETPLVLEAVIKGSLNDAPGLDTARTLWAADQWLRLRPNQADQVQGLVWRGRIFGLAGDHSKALADLRSALELAPHHFEARLELALLVAQKSPEEAIAHLEVLRQRDPKNIRVRYSLATACRSLGRLEEAQQLLDEILAANPNDLSALLERGLVALDALQPEAAEHWLRRALALAPDLPETSLALARCLQLLGKTDEAKHYQNRFLQLDAQRNQKREEPGR